MEEGITLGITGSQLVLYIIGCLMAIGSWVIKRIVNRIEKNYDSLLKENKEDRKELWIEINNLRERISKMEGKQNVQDG